MTRHLVAEISAQLKVGEKKGTVVDRLDAFSRTVLEVLESESMSLLLREGFLGLLLGAENRLKTFSRARVFKNSNDY